MIRALVQLQVTHYYDTVEILNITTSCVEVEATLAGEDNDAAVS